MAQQSFASLAVLVALAFALMALNACASSEQASREAAIVEPQTSTPEFHDAAIGGDALRSRVD